MVMPLHCAKLIFNSKFYQPFGNRTTAISLQIHIIYESDCFCFCFIIQ